MNDNNSKIEQLLAVAEKETKSTVSITLGEVSSEEDDEETSETENASASWNEETKSFESPDGKLVIDKIEIVKGYEDESVLKVSFIITNNTNEEKNVQTLFNTIVDIKQRNENTSNSLSYASLSSNKDNHLSDTLNSNGTVSGFYPLELENESDPIIFDFQYNYDSVYEWEYKLK